MPATRVVPFGPLDTDLYEVWEPPADRTPRGITVVLVHGGLWLAVYDRSYLRPLAGALAQAGFHCALVEYARVGMPGGGWPGTGESLLGALDAAFSDSELPESFVAVGHSSGGQLVAWLASAGRSPQLRGAVVLAGVLDLRLAQQVDPVAAEAIHGLLGGPPEHVPAAWAEADPMPQRLTVPTVVMHGREDTDVPARLAMHYVAAHGADDAPCRLLLVEDSDHFGLVDPRTHAFDELVGAVSELGATAVSA